MTMSALLLAPLLMSAPQGPQFEAPVRLMAGKEAIRVEEPGFAAPCWHDVDGDGKKDLVVGQFAGGKMSWFRHDGKMKFAAAQWLEAGGAVAEVPDVW
jgi:hypothetical protein